MSVFKNDDRGHQLNGLTTSRRALTRSNVKFVNPVILLLSTLLPISIVAICGVELLNCFLINIKWHALNSLLQIELAVLIILTLFDTVGLAQSGILHAAVQAGLLGVGIFTVAVLTNHLALVLDGCHFGLQVGIDEGGNIDDVIGTVTAEGAVAGGAKLEVNELLDVHALVVIALFIVVVIVSLVGVCVLAVVGEISTVVVLVRDAAVNTTPVLCIDVRNGSTE